MCACFCLGLGALRLITDVGFVLQCLGRIGCVLLSGISSSLCRAMWLNSKP